MASLAPSDVILWSSVTRACCVQGAHMLCSNGLESVVAEVNVPEQHAGGSSDGQPIVGGVHMRWCPSRLMTYHRMAGSIQQ